MRTVDGTHSAKPFQGFAFNGSGDPEAVTAVIETGYNIYI